MPEPINKNTKHQTFSTIFESFVMHSAGPGQTGGGVLIFDDQSVRAIPCPESAWASMSCGNWSSNSRPNLDSGEVNPLFLIARAYVISLYALKKSELLFEPAESQEIAWEQIRNDTRASNWAKDARLLAVTNSSLINDSSALDYVADARVFCDLVKVLMKNRKTPEDAKSSDTLKKLADRIAVGLEPTLTHIEKRDRYKLENGKYLEPLKPSPEQEEKIFELCKVIAVTASKNGTVPTKADVRGALKSHRLQSLKEISEVTNRFGEMLIRIGFEWLPAGKAGRPRGT